MSLSLVSKVSWAEFVQVLRVGKPNCLRIDTERPRQVGCGRTGVPRSERSGRAALRSPEVEDASRTTQNQTPSALDEHRCWTPTPAFPSVESGLERVEGGPIGHEEMTGGQAREARRAWPPRYHRRDGRLVGPRSEPYLLNTARVPVRRGARVRLRPAAPAADCLEFCVHEPGRDPPPRGVSGRYAHARQAFGHGELRAGRVCLRHRLLARLAGARRVRGDHLARAGPPSAPGPTARQPRPGTARGPLGHSVHRPRVGELH